MKRKEDLVIVFMGTPEFAAVTLEQLIKEGYPVQSVVTAPDKPAGRGRKIKESAVKGCAQNHQLSILQPSNLKNPSFVEQLKKMKPDLFIVVAFRMLPQLVWKIPSMGTFNLHGSLLPQYRGAAPINWAIINGETKTGVTTFLIDEQIDTGQIILQKEIAISPEETAGELHDRMMVVGAKVVIDTIELIRNEEVKPQKQADVKLKPAPKISKQDCLIDCQKSPKEIHDFIRGLSPYPAAWIELENNTNKKKKSFKIFNSRIINSKKQQELGLFTSNKELHLATPNGLLELLEVQLEGKKRMKASDFLAGFNVNHWSVL